VDQPDNEGIEPEDESSPPLTPEQRLVLAILDRALTDLRSRNPDQVTEAQEFVNSAACDQLCEWLGYPAASLRQFVARNGILP
jgi:hypothetical protein